MARFRFLGLSSPVNEATRFRATTKRREEAPRLAARIWRKEQSKVIKSNDTLFGVSEAAKQNQKFPFHFLSAPPTPPAENLKLRKENFWVLPATKGSGGGAQIGAYDSISLHHAPPAGEI